MKARAYPTALFDDAPANQPWEEAETKEELIRALIKRELMTGWLASHMYKAATNDPRPVAEIHDEQIQLHMGDCTDVQLTVCYEDGTTEQITINQSAQAVQNEGLDKIQINVYKL